MAQRVCAAEPCGTSMWRSCFCGIASRKATSSLERLPQAQRSASKSASETQRIVHSQGELGVAEVLRLVDVVEEVVHPAARDRGPAVREPPAERGLQARREREEVLRGQIGAIVERARQVERREAHPGGEGEGFAEREIPPERDPAGYLHELLGDRGHARQRERG